MLRVLVADPIANEGIERLRLAAEVDVKTGLTPAQLLEIIGDYDAVAVRSETKITAEILACAGRLKIIGRAGVGVDNIDVKAATAQGVLVVNSPEGNTIAAAELSVAMLLALARGIPQAHSALTAGRWERKRFVGTELYGKTLGIVGLGKIGGEVARRAGAFGLRLLAFDPFATAQRAGEVGAVLVSLEELYRQSDFITVHVPLTAETRGLIGREQIAMMRDGVRLINCARGGIVDEVALAEALESGKVGGAALDVFTTEPLSPDSPLLKLDKLIVTPHLGASTAEAQVNVAVDVADQIVAVLNGQPARAAVNMPALSADAMRAAQPWIQLADRMGSLQAQIARDLEGAGRPVDEVEITYQGDFGTVPVGTVTRSVLAGLLTPALSDRVNLVNAPVLAQARGIKVVESQTAQSGEHSALLTLRCHTPAGWHSVAGAVLGPQDVRIVHIDGYRVDLVPEGAMIMTQHTDRPGIIGAVGTLLGDHGINIAGMHVGREKVGGRALMALMVDEPISADMMRAIREVGGMEHARQVML